MSEGKISGTLTLNVIKAEELRDVELIGKQDPYVTLKCGKEEFHSHVHKHGGRAPVWNQSFIFNLDGSQDTLHVVIRDKQLIGSREIARRDLPLREVCTQKGPHFYGVVHPDNFKHMCGRVQFEATFNGTGVARVSAPAATAATPAATVVQPQVVYITAPATSPQQQVVYMPQQQAQQPQIVYMAAPATQQPVTYAPAAQQPIVYAQSPATSSVYSQQPPTTSVVYAAQPPATGMMAFAKAAVNYMTTSPTPMETRIPLYTFWNASRNDNFSCAHADSIASARSAGYSQIRVDSYILQTQVSGTVPLNTYWHGGRQDNFTCAHSSGQRDAQDAGYTFIRTEGYVYPHRHHGTVPLRSFWHASRQDNFTAAHSQGQHDARHAGYHTVRDDCFVFPA